MKMASELHGKLSKRVELCESKVQDVWVMIEDLKRSIPPSSETLMNDLKA